MSSKHTNALKALIATVPHLEGKVFTTEAVRGTSLPYVVVHPANGVNSQERVTGPRSSKHPEFTLHVVGYSGDEVQDYTDAIEEVLFPGGRGVSIDVPGEKGRPLSFAQPTPVQLQTDPQPSIAFAVVEVGWRSDPV